MAIDGIPRMFSYRRPPALGNLGSTLNSKLGEIGGSDEVRGGLARLFQSSDVSQAGVPKEENIRRNNGNSGNGEKLPVAQAEGQK